VFNPHPWPVTEQVEMQYSVQPTGVHVVDADGRLVPSQPVQSVASTDDKGRGATAFKAEVPAFGYRLFRMRPGAPPADSRWSAGRPGRLSATETTLENDILRVEVDPVTGWLAHLVDKRTGVDLVGGAAGEHTQICADPTDTWGHRVVSYDWPGEPMQTTRMVLRENGNLRARLRVERAWGRSTMVEELVLGEDSDVVEVRVTIDWREEAHLMKVRFPVALRDAEATYEIPFGHVRRPVDGAEEPGQSWVDLSGTVDGRPAGLAVVNNAKHGYDVAPASPDRAPSIGITAVRSPVYSWHDPRLLDPRGFYSYQDQGRQHFRYLLVPHGGDWREADLSRRAAQLGAPVRAMLESFHGGRLPASRSYLHDGGGQVMVTAVKAHEEQSADGGAPDIVVRAVETWGRPGTATIDIPLAGVRMTTDFGPGQIRTFRIPASDPTAVVEVNLLEDDLPAAQRPSPVSATALGSDPG
jgi:alpha-mannosidase